MAANLMKKYETELKFKISWKMIPNKTEEQILNQFFKYFDMNGQSMCDLNMFIKAHEKLGVVLPRINDIEEVFNHYDKNGNGVINYKSFSKDILNPSNAGTVHQTGSLSNKFETAFVQCLLKKGGAVMFIKFLKELQIVDYNNSKRISLDDFMKISNEIGIGITSSDIQLLFQSYEMFSNGIIYYDMLVKNITSRYWNSNRENIGSEFYQMLIDMNCTSLTCWKEMFRQCDLDAKQWETLSAFIDCFKFITKSFSSNAPIKEGDIIYFTKWIGFGVESDDELRELLFAISNTQPIINQNNEHSNCDYKVSNGKFPVNNSNQIKKAIPTQDVATDGVKMLRDKLCLFGRTTLFNFIKHFKYYDNNTMNITKYDFAKVLKDYNLSIPLLEIEKMFNKYSTDPQKTKMNYEKFLQSLITSTLSNERENLINEIFEMLQSKANAERREITVDYIKDNYNPRKNYFNSDVSSNQGEFNDSIELFHFSYKLNHSNIVTKCEFTEFYYFISFLVQDDETFISLLRNEWEVWYRQYKTNENKEEVISSRLPWVVTEKPQPHKIQSTYPQKQETPQPKLNSIRKDKTALDIITQKLKSRRVRGLLYWQRQFLQSCPDISKITLEQFINVLQVQYIIWDLNHYHELFSQFKMINSQYLNLSEFIRCFKRELNENRIQCVEQAYTSIDCEGKDSVEIWKVKSKYNPWNERDVISGDLSDEEKYLEFVDTFDINMNWLVGEESDGMVDYEIFANYYEYVSFLFDDDKEFEKNVLGVWC